MINLITVLIVNKIFISYNTRDYIINNFLNLQKSIGHMREGISMKKLLSLVLTVVLVMALVGCSAENNANGELKEPIAKEQNDNEDFSLESISKFNLSEAQRGKNEDPFETVEPLHNVPADNQFVIKLNLGTDPFDDFRIEEQFEVYTDRECKRKLLADVVFDRAKNEITVKPDKSSWGMYARKGVDSEEKRNWGGLQTYYLLIKHDVTATKVTKLEKPKRMMFTVQSNVDIPTVTVKHNFEGNLTLYWKTIEGATEYKIYRGTSHGMEVIGSTEKTEFVLSEDRFRTVAMNTLVGEVYDFAVVAVKGEEQSRLSNIIIGDDLDDIAISKITYGEKTRFSSDEIDTILDLPLKISVDMVKYDGDYYRKTLPIIWDFDNMIVTKGEVEKYVGKVLGTTFTVRYLPFSDLPTDEEIAAFKEKAKANEVSIGAINVEDQIDIPNAPSNEDSKEMSNKDVNEIVNNTEEKVPEKSLEITIAEGMLKHEASIDISMHKEANDPILLKDTLLKVITQYPLILDEENYRYDYCNKKLLIGYRWTKEEALKKQIEIVNKVSDVVGEIIKPDMTIEQKEQALHDWVTSRGEYHIELLEAFYDGKDMRDISEQYADSFNPYGILINGLGVCQSYAESYKLLCDAANVPCVVASGTVGSVPHAWNKVRLNDTWYHVDATNNDGDSIPYAVYNASDKVVSTDFTTSDEYILNSELKNYVSDKDDKDYYMINGQFAQSEEDLNILFSKYVKTGEDFCIKVSPSIPDDTIIKLLAINFTDYPELASKAKFAKMFNVLKIFY